MYTYLVLILAIICGSDCAFKSTAVESEAYDLNEGPVWDEKQKVLLHVDINKHKVCKLTPSTQKSECITLTDLLTIVHPFANSTDEYIVTQRNKLVHLTWSTKKTVVLGEVATALGGRERFNDGKPDANGVMWLGTFTEPFPLAANTGNLYKYDGTNIVKMAGNFTLTNGMTWSLDNKKMYINDSDQRKIFKFDFDLAKGTISNRGVVLDCNNNADFKKDENPDGLTIDANGHLWASLYGGGRVIKVNPDTGKVEESVPLNAGPLTTSLSFGGDNLDELYVTVAYLNGGPDQRTTYPNAGRVHRITSDTAGALKGTLMYRFK